MFFLFVSAVVMVFNHYFPEINNLRTLLLDSIVLQSPSGIALYQFTFGYQLAALTPFLLLYTFVYHKPFFLKILVFILCIGFIYLGMQRSVFVTFFCAVLLFLIITYKFKAILIALMAIVIGVSFYGAILKDNIDTNDNILTKEENNKEEFNRSGLMEENIN